MTERRYTDDEVAAIFEKASKAQAGDRRQLPAGEGATLASLQEIGREVGIPPELVAQAARALDRSGSDHTRTLLGMPIGVSRTVNLGRKIGDAEWEQLVVTLRTTFDATGRVRVDGAFRQWSNGALQILVEPTPTGHQVRMKTFRTQSAGLIAGGIALVGLVGTLALSLAATGRLGEPRPLSGIVMLGAIGVLTFAWGALGLPGWSRERRRQMQELAERLTTADPR